jgi:hypothetical protein
MHKISMQKCKATVWRNIATVELASTSVDEIMRTFSFVKYMILT